MRFKINRVNRQRRYPGFTIVELLIVIVVVAILASIAIVAYTGTTNKAHNNTVKADLSNIAKQIHVLYATHDTYPQGGYVLQSEGGSSSGHVSGAPSGLTFKVSSSAYHQPGGTSGGYANFIYCAGPSSLTSGVESFAVTAQSASRANFRYNSLSGLEEINSTVSPSTARACNGIGYPRSVSYGYFVNSGGWQPWTL